MEGKGYTVAGEAQALLLAIETSTNIGSVAVGHGGAVLAEVVLGVQTRHAGAVVPAIDFVLTSAGATRDDVTGVVVGAGPGSFTGVRVGGATAKGLVRALGVPLYAYSGLMALAASVAPARAVCALFDARRDEVYAACYAFDETVTTILAPTVAHIDTVLDTVGQHTPLYVGDGALRYREAIEARGGLVAPAHLAVPRAGALLWLASRWPEEGLVHDLAAWEPEYLREPGAVRGIQG